MQRYIVATPLFIIIIIIIPPPPCIILFITLRRKKNVVWLCKAMAWRFGGRWPGMTMQRRFPGVLDFRLQKESNCFWLWRCISFLWLRLSRQFFFFSAKFSNFYNQQIVTPLLGVGGVKSHVFMKHTISRVHGKSFGNYSKPLPFLQHRKKNQERVSTFRSFWRSNETIKERSSKLITAFADLIQWVMRFAKNIEADCNVTSSQLKHRRCMGKVYL